MNSYLWVPVGTFIPIMLGAILWAFIHPDLRFVMLLWPFGFIGGLFQMTRLNTRRDVSLQ